MTALHKVAMALLLSITSVGGAPRARIPRYRKTGHAPVATSNAERAAQTDPAAPPVLLTTPAYYGTLAAVRTIGRSAISVTTAGPTRWNVSAFSKYSGHHLICPPTSDGKELIEWLEEFGSHNERHVLLPTCDDTAGSMLDIASGSLDTSSCLRPTSARCTRCSTRARSRRTRAP
jgi:hypothetical protein